MWPLSLVNSWPCCLSFLRISHVISSIFKNAPCHFIKFTHLGCLQWRTINVAVFTYFDGRIASSSSFIIMAIIINPGVSESCYHTPLHQLHTCAYQDSWDAETCMDSKTCIWFSCSHHPNCCIVGHTISIVAGWSSQCFVADCAYRQKAKPFWYFAHNFVCYGQNTFTVGWCYPFSACHEQL